MQFPPPQNNPADGPRPATTTATTGLPAGIGLSHVRVHRSITPDGQCGGTPHMHLTSTELYLPLQGRGAAEFLTPAGPQRVDLHLGHPVQFTPGTLHRLITDEDPLELAVVMENGRLNEVGDVVFTFPPEDLADPDTYHRLAAVTDEASVLRRRDRAVEGFTRLTNLWRQDPTRGHRALADFHSRAVQLVRHRAAGWEDILVLGPGRALHTMTSRARSVTKGEGTHLADAAVTVLPPLDENALVPRSCGWLWSYQA